MTKTHKPVLLIDTEHNEVHTLIQKQSDLYRSLYAGMGYGKVNHWRFSNKQHVRSSQRPYWHVVDPDPVVLEFGLWDAAEMRRAKDVAGVGKPSLKKVTAEDWVETKTLNAKTENWKPQGRLTIV